MESGSFSQESAILGQDDYGFILNDLLNSNIDQEIINRVDPLTTECQAYPEENKHNILQMLHTGTREETPEEIMNSNMAHMANNIGMPPMLQPAVLANEDYPGPLCFEVLINSHTASRNTWVYSNVLNKIFINMGNPLPIDFKWTPALGGLQVRATPLYSLPQHSQEYVQRCIPHAAPTDVTNKGMPEYMWNHVLRCTSQSAQYDGSAQEGRRLNVVVPLGQPQAGSDVVRHLYQFVCKNSCPSGMNRKPFEVVFTLEKIGRQIIGRRTVSVRVCSCPKRDKDKEENEIRKDKMEHPPAKKRRHFEKKPVVNNDDTSNKIYDLCFRIIGKGNRDTVLKIAHSLMVSESANMNGNQETYKAVIAELDVVKNRD